MPLTTPLPQPLAAGAGPGLFAKGLSRRKVLALTGFSGAALWAGAWLYRHVWKLPPPGPGRACLTNEEHETAGAMAEVFFPGPPDVPFTAAEVKLADFADGFIAGQYEDTQRLFRLVLRAVEQWPALRRGRFSTLPLDERRRVLLDFRDSHLMVRRAAYQSMRYLFSLGYFEDLRVRRAGRLKFGCDLSSRFPEMAHWDVDG